MGNSNRKLKKITEWNYPLSFDNKIYHAKVLEITSCCKCTVVFKYKKKYTTWNIKLKDCYDTNLIIEEYKNNAKEYLSNLLRKNNNICRIKCDKLEDGFINVVMYVKGNKTSVNKLIIDSGYNGNPYNCSIPMIENEDKLVTTVDLYQDYTPSLLPIKEEKPNLLMKYETMEDLTTIDGKVEVENFIETEKNEEIANIYDDTKIDNLKSNNSEEITYDTNHQIIDEEITISENAVEDVIDKETQVEEYQLQNKNYLEVVAENKEKQPFQNELFAALKKRSIHED